MLPLILLLTLAGDGLGVHKKCVLNMVNPKASLSPSLSCSLSLTLAMRNLLFSLAIFFRGMHV